MDSVTAARGAYVDQKTPLYCGFCERSHEQLEVMVKGACDNAICSECIATCAEIVLAHQAMTAGEVEYQSWLVA